MPKALRRRTRGRLGKVSASIENSQAYVGRSQFVALTLRRAQDVEFQCKDGVVATGDC